jgi:hypothetical protein
MDARIRKEGVACVGAPVEKKQNPGFLQGFRQKKMSARQLARQ